jgi:hypothetical protein
MTGRWSAGDEPTQDCRERDSRGKLFIPTLEPADVTGAVFWRRFLAPFSGAVFWRRFLHKYRLAFTTDKAEALLKGLSVLRDLGINMAKYRRSERILYRDFSPKKPSPFDVGP